jgi:hypothetical protein
MAVPTTAAQAQFADDPPYPPINPAWTPRSATDTHIRLNGIYYRSPKSLTNKMADSMHRRGEISVIVNLQDSSAFPST